MYCYLQINLHKFRMLLLLPFVVSHCLFYLCLHYPLDDNTRSFKDAPTHYRCTSPAIESLQIARVKQIPKSIASSQPLTDDLVRVVYQAPVRSVFARRSYVPSPSVTAFNPPALFPTRASPS